MSLVKRQKCHGRPSAHENVAQTLARRESQVGIRSAVTEQDR